MTPRSASLTGALVDANDRLLGLLSLITNDPPTSLAADDMITAIVERAAPILDLDLVELHGAQDYTWSRVASSDHEASWSTSIELTDLGTLDLSFGRIHRRFDTPDTKLLGAVARLLANAVATAHVHHQAIAQEVVAREHATAAQVAAAALPDQASMPERTGLSFFAHLTPARETGGDLFTWQEIDSSVWFAIGDVSGKGLPAAVLMSTAMTAVEASITRSHNDGPVAVVSAVDRWLHQRLSNAAMFVTLAIGVWDADTETLTVANSGHSPIVWCGAEGSYRIEASAPPLGVIAGLTPDAWTTPTRPGDLLVLATDGFTEQPNAHGDLFGEDHFDTSVHQARPLGDAGRIGETLLAQVAAHGLDCPQSDDRALMVLSFS